MPQTESTCQGGAQLYIDGGVAIQSFLKEDLIDEMIITVLPILLGGGSPLSGELSKSLDVDFVNTEVVLNAMVKNYYRRKQLPRLRPSRSVCRSASRDLPTRRLPCRR